MDIDNDCASEVSVQDWEKESYPHALWALYVHEMQVEEKPEIVNQAVILLAAAGVSQGWQLLELTQDDLEKVLPQATHMREYLATKFVISRLRATSSSSKEPNIGAIAEAVVKLGKNIKSSQPKRTKDLLDTDSEDEKRSHFNANAMLEVYGLEAVPHEHMPRSNYLEKVAKKAKSTCAAKKDFMAPGGVVDYWPQWMGDPPKATDQCPTHAHWCAAWWSRALTQLTAQAAAEQESVSFGTLLTEFLNLNKVAIQQNGRTAWQYDQEKWSHIHERAQRYDPTLDIPAVMKELSHGEVNRINEEVQKRYDKDQHAKPRKSDERFVRKDAGESESPSKGKGKDQGFILLKPGFVSSAVAASWNDEPPKKHFKGKGKEKGKSQKKKSWTPKQEETRET